MRAAQIRKRSGAHAAARAVSKTASGKVSGKASDGAGPADAGGRADLATVGPATVGPACIGPATIGEDVAAAKAAALAALADLRARKGAGATGQSTPLLGDGFVSDGLMGGEPGAYPASPMRSPLGIASLDAALDPHQHRGIAVNSLHEVRADAALASASAAGFGLALALSITRPSTTPASLKRARLPVFWLCDAYTGREHGRFYAPGLAAFGLQPESLVRIMPGKMSDLLWAAGEIASARDLARCCLIELRGNPKDFDLAVTRRLMMRAQVSGVPVIVLRQSGAEEASAAATRWHVLPTASSPAVSIDDVAGGLAAHLPIRDRFIGPPGFRVRLEKCRGGQVTYQAAHSPAADTGNGEWLLEWNPHEYRFEEQCMDVGRGAPDRAGDRADAVDDVTNSAARVRNFPGAATASNAGYGFGPVFREAVSLRQPAQTGDRPLVAAAAGDGLAAEPCDVDASHKRHRIKRFNFAEAVELTERDPGAGEFFRRKARKLANWERG